MLAMYAATLYRHFMGDKKKLKIKHSTLSSATPLAWQSLHYEAAALAREHPGRWVALFVTGFPAAYSTVSRYRTGARRPLAYAGDGFEFKHARVEGASYEREVCVRWVKPSKRKSNRPRLAP